MFCSNRKSGKSVKVGKDRDMDLYTSSSSMSDKFEQIVRRSDKFRTTNEMCQMLLADPAKRALVLELLTKQGVINSNKTVKKHRPLKRLQESSIVHQKNEKVKLLVTSRPSDLLRKRSLKKLDNDSCSDISDSGTSSSHFVNTRPMSQVLVGVTVYCEVRSSEGDRSEAIKAVIGTMGAAIRDTFSNDVTHVIFKDGSFKTYQKAKLLRVYLVSVLWVEAVRRHKYKVPESLYPVVGMGERNGNMSLICKKLEQDFNSTLHEEVKNQNKMKHFSELTKSNLLNQWSDISSVASNSSSTRNPASTVSEFSSYKVNPAVCNGISGSESDSEASSLDKIISKYNSPLKLLRMPQATKTPKKDARPSSARNEKATPDPSSTPSSTVRKSRKSLLPRKPEDKLNETVCSTPRRSTRISCYNLPGRSEKANQDDDALKNLGLNTPNEKPVQKKTTLRKLFKLNQSVDETLFNWDEAPSSHGDGDSLNSTVYVPEKSRASELAAKCLTEPRKRLARVPPPEAPKKKLLDSLQSTPSLPRAKRGVASAENSPKKREQVAGEALEYQLSDAARQGAAQSSIVCTHFHRDEVQVFQQIVHKLGRFRVQDEVTRDTTHLVAHKSIRTINMLRAVARGCWVLRREWLYASLDAGHWLPEDEYELTDFSRAVQMNRLKRLSLGPKFSVDIFKECGNVFVCRSSTPRCSDLEELVSLCGGTVVRSSANAKVIVGEFMQDVGDATCVNEKWVLDSITLNKMKSLKHYKMSRRLSISY